MPLEWRDERLRNGEKQKGEEEEKKWGSTYGPISAAARLVRNAGTDLAQAHVRHLNPFPANLGDVLHRYDRVIVPEMNLGQLALLLRGHFLVDVQSHTQVRGLPFTASELAEVLHKEAIIAEEMIR